MVTENISLRIVRLFLGNREQLLSDASPTTQDEDQFAAAAPRQALPGLGLAIPGDLETATRAFEALAKRQKVLGDHPLRTTTTLPTRLGQRSGRHGRLVEGGDLLPGQSFAGPGSSQQTGSLGHVPPCLSFPGLVRVVAVTSIFKVPPSGRSEPSFR